MSGIHSVISSSDVRSVPGQVAVEAKNFDWGDWDQAITDAVVEPNAVMSNLKITRLHYLLAHAMRDVLGEDAGANFHTWAVWGSRKAGVTIRQEDRDQARRDGTVVGSVVGGLIGLFLGAFLYGGSSWSAVLAWGLFGGCCGGLTGRLIVHRSRQVASQLILHGNQTVLDDIGRQSARFIVTFRDAKEADPRQLERFLAGLRSGGSEADGQDLLRQSFSLYWQAKYTSDPKKKHETAYFANCLAVLHEHIRLQPDIKGSLPWIISKCVTQRLMQFDIGSTQLDVSHDVPSLTDLPYPPTLTKLYEPELVEFLHGANGWDKTSRRLARTAAEDWTNLRERMRYIVNLFRVLHLSPTVWQAPYSDECLKEISADRLPSELI
ncbi:MAG TPA: hypothetical protein VNQ76_19015 [Planctomicrobium sp.]|nr:hypothetical protein [Planctomicrobium sp.]